MRAVVLSERGGPEVLEVDELDDPEPGPEEVLIEVVSSALNRADLLQRMGTYPGPRTTREVPGLELAGHVVKRGARVQAWDVGDAVMGIVAGGGHASLAAVHERQLLAVPASVASADAGAIPEVFLTAFDALVVQGGLTSGRVALVHAGGSGVGTAAIQIARAVGAEVVVTASSGKLEACSGLGADVAVDYAAEDFVAAVHDLTAGRGADVVLDVIGGEYLDRNVDALAVGGRILQVGTMGESSASVPLGKLMVKRASLVGTVLRPRPIDEKIVLTQRFGVEMLPLFDRGLLRPVIDSRFALSDVVDAHRRMESNANVGKIVLDTTS